MLAESVVLVVRAGRGSMNDGLLTAQVKLWTSTKNEFIKQNEDRGEAEAMKMRQDFSTVHPTTPTNSPPPPPPPLTPSCNLIPWAASAKLRVSVLKVLDDYFLNVSPEPC